MDFVTDWLTHNFGIQVETQEKFLTSFIAITILLIIRKIILNIVTKKNRRC